VGRLWKGDLFEAERKNIEQAKKYAKMAYDITQAIGTELGEEAFRQYDAIQSGDPSRLRELGSEHRQVAALMLGLVVELQKQYKDLPAETKGRIVGAVTWEIAQTTAEILLTAGASKAATGSAKFAALAAKLQKWDKAKDIAEIVQKLFVKGGKLDRLMGKLDEIVGAVGDASKASRGARVAGEVVEKMCFTPDTLVSTSDGVQRLGDINPGVSVYAFDFENRQWALSEVLQRHDNSYSGLMVSIQLGGTQIEATAHHPFWVVEGDELPKRPCPEHLSPREDQSRAFPGRWVDSNDLRVGDLVACRDGQHRRIEAVEKRDVEAFAVCSLTIREFHSFAVGEGAVLVHNADWCSILKKVLPKPDALVKYAEKLGFESWQVHAHHIVQKFYDPVKATVKGSKHWYIRETQEILKRFDVPLLDDMDDALLRANRGEKLHNLTWAINGNGTHKTATVRQVYERLATARSKMDVETILDDLSQLFIQGKVIANP